MKAKLFFLIPTALIVSKFAFGEPLAANGQSIHPRETASLVDEAKVPEQGGSPLDVWPSPVDDDATHSYFLAEIFEYRWNKGDDTTNWDVFGWYGGDYNRLWIKSEGFASTGKTSGDADFQLLYGRLVSSYFDFQVGLRYEQLWDAAGSDHSRGLASIGFQGLAPYYFDLEPTLFISQDGDVSARFTATYDILLTQRLILQPRLDGNAAVQDTKKFGVGSGLNELEVGCRLRYELSREFAPYIGISYGRRFGETVDFARSDGEDLFTWSFVSGVRFWF